jgi:hypothetical protein
LRQICLSIDENAQMLKMVLVCLSSEPCNNPFERSTRQLLQECVEALSLYSSSILVSRVGYEKVIFRRQESPILNEARFNI